MGLEYFMAEDTQSKVNRRVERAQDFTAVPRGRGAQPSRLIDSRRVRKDAGGNLAILIGAKIYRTKSEKLVR